MDISQFLRWVSEANRKSSPLVQRLAQQYIAEAAEAAAQKPPTAPPRG